MDARERMSFVTIVVLAAAGIILVMMGINNAGAAVLDVLKRPLNQPSTVGTDASRAGVSQVGKAGA